MFKWFAMQHVFFHHVPLEVNVGVQSVVRTRYVYIANNYDGEIFTNVITVS